MIITARRFERVEPSRTAKKIYIFSEGKKREPQYFNFFVKIDSRINFIIYRIKEFEDHSPDGLFRIAENYFYNNELSTGDDFEFKAEIDEVWFIIDTDSWGVKIVELRDSVGEKTGWYVSQSNPCFEVWLNFHKFAHIPKIQQLNECNTWKNLVQNQFPGGFDSRKHPVLLKKAIINSKKNYKEINGQPSAGSTELF